MDRKKRIILVILELILVIGVTIGVTLAFLSYTKEGTKENTITAGAVTFHYNEDSGQGISLIDALPISDGAGQTQNNYFDFTITSNNGTEVNIPYMITARKVGNDETRIDPKYVKVYLTKVTTENDTDSETEVLFDNYNNLGMVTKNNHDEEVLWIDSVAANTLNYTQKYRLRIWLDSSLDFSPLKDNSGNYIEENGEYVYPNNNKQFSIKVNVYADNQTTYTATPANISSLSVNGTSVTPVDDTYEIKVDSSTAAVNIDTDDPYATIKIEKTDSTYENVIALGNNIQRLSTVKTLNLTDPVNYFKITITASNKVDTTVQKLKITREIYPVLSPSGITGPASLSEDALQATAYDNDNTTYLAYDSSRRNPNNYMVDYYANVDSAVWGSEILVTQSSVSLEYCGLNVAFKDASGTKLSSTEIGCSGKHDPILVPMNSTKLLIQIQHNARLYEIKTSALSFSNNAQVNDYIDISYSGEQKMFIAKTSGNYKLEVWGAQGGDINSTYRGGYGGYSTGIIHLNSNEMLYINVGGKGVKSSANILSVAQGGYNGGGDGFNQNQYSNRYAASGGGATHIATKTGVLSSLSSEGDRSKIIIVAGGGGGSWCYLDATSYCNKTPGDAGGFTGVTGVGKAASTPNEYFAEGGGQEPSTQTDNSTNNNLVLGSFGQGANSNKDTNPRGSGGGGGGYYGGNINVYAAGGGSGYIANNSLNNKAMYCINCTESNTPSTYTVNTSPSGTSNDRDLTNCPNGYSSNPVAKCAKSGDGYARITYLGN